MMKWIFGALLLANVGVWMWAHWYREPAVETAFRARPDVAPDKMKLLSEPDKASKAKRPAPPAAAASACFHVGPFLDAKQADLVGEKLEGLKLQYTRDAGERKAVTGYRVQLTPLESKAAADRKRRELTQLGFKDHALINEPGFENAISLGVFSVEANAKAQASRLAAKDIKTSIVAIETTRLEIWFDVTAAADADQTLAKALDSELRSVQGTVASVECRPSNRAEGKK